MATTDSTLPVNGNGNYAHQTYEANNLNNFASAASNASAYGAAQAPAPASAAATSEIPKDEVGWYFVEQYYTTLSKTPDRLYLFYNKRSQYVSGTEEDKMQVCVGQKSINDQIKNLDFHDTKVRVTNVDSQGSDANIVIQVIGEISNRGQPHRKFVQTFVLAEQTNGYFVLNDIFRYLADESDDEEELAQEPEAVPTGVQEPAPSTDAAEVEEVTVESVAKGEEELVKVDQAIEEAAQEEPAAAEAAPEEAAPAQEEAVAEEAAPAAAKVEETPAEVAEPVVEETAAPAEKEAAPAPAPAAAPAAAQKPAAPAAPAAPQKPKSWAALAASAHKVALPSVPSSSTAQAPAQPKAANQAQPQAAPAAQSSAPAREPSPVNSQGEAAGWQSVTGHKKEQSRGQNQAPAAPVSEFKRGYIKNVYSQVEESALKEAMAKFGEVQYMDVSRPKNCAFVDFKTLAAFQAAIAANPHTVNGIELIVEERRMNPRQSFSPFPRGGGGAPRGRGGPSNGNGPRGGFNPRGGRGGAARGAARPPVTEA